MRKFLNLRKVTPILVGVGEVYPSDPHFWDVHRLKDPIRNPKWTIFQLEKNEDLQEGKEDVGLAYVIERYNTRGVLFMII